MIGAKEYTRLLFDMSVKEKIRSFLTRKASTRIFLFLQEYSGIEAKSTQTNDDYGNELVKVCYDEMGKDGTFFSKLWTDFGNELEDVKNPLLDLYRFAAFYSRHPTATKASDPAAAFTLKLYFAEILSLLWLTGNKGNTNFFAGLEKAQEGQEVKFYLQSFTKTFAPDNLVGWYVGHQNKWPSDTNAWGAPLFNFEHPYAFGHAPVPFGEPDMVVMLDEEGNPIKDVVQGPWPWGFKPHVFAGFGTDPETGINLGIPQAVAHNRAHDWWKDTPGKEPDHADKALIKALSPDHDGNFLYVYPGKHGWQGSYKLQGLRVYDTRKCEGTDKTNCPKISDPSPYGALYDMKAFNFDGKSLYRWAKPNASMASYTHPNTGATKKCNYPGPTNFPGLHPWYVYQVVPGGMSTLPAAIAASTSDCWPYGIRAANFSYTRWDDIINKGYWLEYFFRVKNIPLFKEFWPTGQGPATAGFYSNYLSFREFALLMKTIMDKIGTDVKAADAQASFFDSDNKAYPAGLGSAAIIKKVAEQLDVSYGVRLMMSLPGLAAQTNQEETISKTYEPSYKLNMFGSVGTLRNTYSSPQKASADGGWKNNNPAAGVYKNKTYLYNFLEGEAWHPEKGKVKTGADNVEWFTSKRSVLTLAEHVAGLDVHQLMKNMANYYSAVTKNHADTGAASDTLNWYADQEIDKLIVKEHSEDLLAEFATNSRVSNFIESVALNLGKPVLSGDPNYYDTQIIQPLKNEDMPDGMKTRLLYYDEGSPEQATFANKVKDQMDKTIDNNLKIAINKLLEGT